MRPQLYVLAGGNGAGKSTFYARFLEPKGLRFVNADEIAKLPSPEDAAGGSYAAAAVAAEIRSGMLRRRESFCFETVFSHHSKIDFLAEAKALGYEIILLIIHLDCPDLNVARVAQRVEQGGHDVPEEKIRARIPRTIQNLKVALSLCDRVMAFENSCQAEEFRHVFTLAGRDLRVQMHPLPAWAEMLTASNNLPDQVRS